MISKHILRDIRALAIDIDHHASFAGKSKGNKHLSRVIRVADFLAQKNEADRSIVFAGAVLHDTALPSGNDYDYNKNKKIVTNLLKKFQLSQIDVGKIAECVGSHEGTVQPKSLEAKIVHDADVLEKTGLLGIIRHTWKMTNLGVINYQAVTHADVRMILDHIAWRGKKLHTPLAKKMRSYLTIPLSITKTTRIITIVAELAFQGIITEKIAIRLRKFLNQKEYSKLREQLQLGYLKKFK